MDQALPGPLDPSAPGLTGLGEVSAMLAHELRNPLAAIKGHAQLLAELLPMDDARHERAERVVVEVQRLERLVDDLLILAGEPRAHRVPSDPVALAHAAAGRAPARVAVRVVQAPERWPLDPAHVVDALSRLIEGGLHSLSGRAGLCLEVDCRPGVLQYSIYSAEKDVSTRTDDLKQFGVSRIPGLGMAIIRRAAALHGGHLVLGATPDGAVTLLLTDQPR